MRPGTPGRCSAFVIGADVAGRTIAHKPEDTRLLSSTLVEAHASRRGTGRYLELRSHPMCDYSLHAVASRPAIVGETLITTTFRGTSTRGFASENDPAVAVCMLPGTELAFAREVKFDNRWIWTRTLDWRVGKFNHIEPEMPDRHHDAIEFPDGSRVLVTQLCED